MLAVSRARSSQRAWWICPASGPARSSCSPSLLRCALADATLPPQLLLLLLLLTSTAPERWERQVQSTRRLGGLAQVVTRLFLAPLPPPLLDAHFACVSFLTEHHTLCWPTFAWAALLSIAPWWPHPLHPVHLGP